MTTKWNFAFDNAPLSPAIEKKLEALGVLNPLPETDIPGATEVRFVKDFFTHDGYPKLPEGTDFSKTAYPYIFPAIAPWYDGASVPAAVVEMDPLYRQTACQAAMAYLKNLNDNARGVAVQDTSLTFHGLAFQMEVLGQTHTFAFPDTRINPLISAPAAVVLIADSYRNDESWQKQASVPLYARQQAMFQLWCWDQFAMKGDYEGVVPRVAYVVRISGNLPTDCCVRTVQYDRKEAEALIKRICKARNMESEKGLYWKRNIEQPQAWADKVHSEAFMSEDENTYDLICQYMKAKADRKQNEKELKEVTDKMDAIAIELASLIPSGNMQGNYELPDGTICTVTHQLRRSMGVSISTDLVRSFFPALDGCIKPTAQERKTVTIDVL